MQQLDPDLPRTSRASFDQAVWRERAKNLEAKEASAAAAAALANATDESDQSSEDSPRAESVASQVHRIPAASACS